MGLRRVLGLHPPEPAAQRPPGPRVAVYLIEGMRDADGVAEVRARVEAAIEVEEIRIHLATGRLTVASTDIDDEKVKAAVAESGFRVVARI